MSAAEEPGADPRAISARHPFATAREMGIMQGFPPPPAARPSLTDWDLGPFNRWSFLNVRSLIPTVDVPRGRRAAAIPEAAEALDDLACLTAAGEPTTLGRHLAESWTDGFCILHRGRMIFERYFNDMTPATLHLAQSVSKSVTGILAGILHGEGLLDLDRPLRDIVPELAGCGYGGATLAQVLDMRSGVRFDETYDAANSDMAAIDVASGWRPAPAGGPHPTIRDVILTLPQERPHGGAFSYRSVETDVIAWAIERAAGRRLADLVSERIWAPIGAERDAAFTVDAAGTALADGGFNATLRDFARFGEMVRNFGMAGDVRVAPAAWIEGMRAGDPSAFGAPYTALSPKGAYRRQWWIHDTGRGDLMARGVFGQLIYIDFAAGMTVVKLSTWPTYLRPDLTAGTLNAAAAVRAALGAG
jgi:CubicO group peptidase (beta-lactamase class C family)